ncbi:MAG: hypothetical protein H6607_08910 [Flavobacteriales bacterium]|nr:hypothetical protein [Flavobacteriales bacterium]
MKKYWILLMMIAVGMSCGKIKQKSKEAINKTGEAAGKGAGEFFEGVADGVEKTLECNIVISEKLKESGLRSGAYQVSSDSKQDFAKVLSMYFIFDKDFDTEVTVKTTNEQGLETGRSKSRVTGKMGESSYTDFVFDKRTEIGNKATIEFQ